MLKKGIAVTTGVSMVMLAVLLFTTTPQTTGPLGILALFVFMYLTALGVLTFLFRSLDVYGYKFLLTKTKRVSSTPQSLRRSYYRASVLALVPVMLIAMQSVGEVGPYQLLLVLFFTVIAWLYVANRAG